MLVFLFCEVFTDLVEHGVSQLGFLEEGRRTSGVYLAVPGHVKLLEVALEERAVVPGELEGKGCAGALA